MADGKTHDIITILTAIPISILYGILCGNAVGIMFGIGYLFAGLMFNGDLDTISTPYYRWWLLRFIWIPYRRFGHRSVWTHGFLRGTFTRLLWVSPIIISLFVVQGNIHGYSIIINSMMVHWRELFSLVLGLEIGAMSHTIADISSSAWKRFAYRNFGIRILPSFIKNKRRTDG